MPALPGLPLRASTPSVRGGAGNAAGKAKDERHEDEGDFGDFPDVGLSIPRGRAGGVPHREVARKPSACHSQCSWGLPLQSVQRPTGG